MYLNLASSSYLWIGKNLLCADKGYINIAEKNHCKAAAEERALAFTFETESDYPKGCYLDGGKVWFNDHSVGSRLSDAAPICTGIFHRSRITILKYDNINIVKTPDFNVYALLQYQINILILERIIAEEMTLMTIQQSKLQKKHVQMTSNVVVFMMRIVMVISGL